MKIFLFNCSLTDNQTLKLCDSALSRDLFPSDYHCLGDNNNRPIKWMPLESINQNRFSRASDVVSIKVIVDIDNRGLIFPFLVLSDNHEIPRS